MTELYQNLNKTYSEFLGQLIVSFGDDSNLCAESDFVRKTMAKNGKETDLIYQHVVGGMSSIVERIHSEDMSVFTCEKNKERIALFEAACIYRIYPRMQPHEQKTLWQCVRSLAQQICTIKGSARNLDRFTNIAKSFVKSNPDVNESNVQARLLAQLFSNRDLATEAKEMFLQSDMSTMRGDLAEILRGQGFTAKKVEQEEEEEGGGEEGEEGEEGGQGSGEEKQSSTEQKIDEECLSSVFAAMAAKDRDIKSAAKHKRKNAKNPIAKIVDYLENRTLSEAEIAEMKEVAKNTLGGNDNADRRRMQQLFSVIGDGLQRGDNTLNLPETISKLKEACINSETTAAAGEEQSEIEQVD